MPWTNWNIKNRKMYLFLLINTSKPTKLSAYNVVDIDNSNAIQVSK